MGQTPSPAAPPDRRRRSRRAALVAAAGVGVLLSTTGCTAKDVFLLGIPDPATDQGRTIFELWQGSWVAAWIVGAFVWGLMIYAMIVFRRRHATQIPRQTRYNVPIEILYTVTPLIMIAGIFYFTQRDQTEIMRVSDDDVSTVQVVGMRWSWTFNYRDADVYDVGSPTEAPTLWLPVDEKVRFELVSPDVAHSFWVPKWLFKMDAIPGRLNVFEVTPDTTGTFAGKCAELCGELHARMLFNVRVVPRAEYDAHIADLKARGQTGQLVTGRTNTDAGTSGKDPL